MSDPVNSPSHYKLNAEGVECIDAIKASMSPLEYQGYLKGNAMKYLWRFRYKNHPVQDLKKAQWYLAKLTEEQGKPHANRPSSDNDSGIVPIVAAAAFHSALASERSSVSESDSVGGGEGRLYSDDSRSSSRDESSDSGGRD